MNNKEQEKAKPTKIKPWYRLEAMGRLTGDDIFFEPKEVRKLDNPDLVVIACLPSEYVWKSGKLTRTLLTTSDYDIHDRFDALKWVKSTYPGSKIRVYVADDDWKYDFVDDYQPDLIEAHRIYLQEILVKSFGDVEVLTVSKLVSSIGWNYTEVQSEIIKKLSTPWPQLPGWLKAIYHSVNEKTHRKVSGAGGEIDEESLTNIGKLQIGMAIQGMALRKYYSTLMKQPLYLGMYGDILRFRETEMKIMMESKLTSLGFVGKPIASIFCPEGKLDMDLLEMITGIVSREMNPQVTMTTNAGFHSDEYIKSKISQTRLAKGRIKPKACDDI